MAGKKILLAILLFLTTLSAFGQRDVKGIIRELNGLRGGDRVSARNISIDISSGDERVNLNIKRAEFLEFRSSNYELFEERFRNILDNLDDDRYQVLSTRKSNETILMRSRNNQIREVIIFKTGSRFGMIRVQGKISIPEFWEDIARELNLESLGNNPRPERPAKPARPQRPQRPARPARPAN